MCKDEKQEEVHIEGAKDHESQKDLLDPAPRPIRPPSQSELRSRLRDLEERVYRLIPSK